MKTLWKVTIETTVIVMAEDEPEAREKGTRYAREQYDEPDFVDVDEIKNKLDIPKEYQDSLPWGIARGDNRTCSQILQDQGKL